MIPSFNSRFAHDIKNMMEWRETLGYTKSCYSQQLKDFDSYCMKTFPGNDVLTWEIALAYLQAYRERRDIRIDVAMLRNLGKYQVLLGKEACIFPADYFGYKKRRLPYIMSAEECQRFFEATDHYPHDVRAPLLEYTVAVLFRLQYATGMRPQEVRHLTRQDFNFTNDTIYITDSKRHKDRCIAVSSKIMEMCRKYDIIARSIYPDTKVFFPNKNKKEYCARDIQNLFHKCWEMAGNPTGSEYCTPYILRHNFATQTLTKWMEEGRDFEQYIPYLSAYMGHQTFSSTYYYVHLIPERVSRMECMDISDIVGGIL